MRTAQAVATGSYNRGDIFPQQLEELIALFDGKVPDDSLAKGVLLQPQIDTRPELWMLGSSDFGGLLAAQLGIRCAFAHFINAQYGHRVAEAYRERFMPGHEAKPYLAAAIFVICADTDREAEALERAVNLRRIQIWPTVSISLSRFRPSRKASRRFTASANSRSSRTRKRAASSARRSA